MNSSTFQSITSSIATRFSRFGWSPTAQQFTGADGKLVPPKTARVIVDEQIAVTGRRLERLGEALKKADRGDGWAAAVQKYADEFQAEIKALRLQCGALGDGGLHPMTREAWGRVEADVKRQFEFHADVTKELLANPDYADSGRFAAHGDGYARNARFTYENEKAESHRANGFPFEVQIQYSIHGCPTCTSRDMVVVEAGTYGPLGEDCECGPGCQCRRDQLRENPDAD